MDSNNAEKISVVINTYNAAKHLDKVLDAVKDFDEIVVCDMDSQDDTVAIAKRHGCKIVHFPRRNFSICEPARQTAIDAATSRWILVIDADEVVSPQLHDYLYSLVKSSEVPQGLYIPRKSYFMGKFMHCFYPDYQLRFFIKEGTYWPPIIHANPSIKGKVEKIPAERKDLALNHLADGSVQCRIGKINQYTENEVEKKKNKHYGTLALFYRPLVRFFRAYIQKGGFRDGKAGLVCACYEGIYQFAAVSKLMEHRRKSNPYCPC